LRKLKRRSLRRLPANKDDRITQLHHQQIYRLSMKVLFFSAHTYDRDSFNAIAKPSDWTFDYHPGTLSTQDASIAAGHEVVCIFVNDNCNGDILRILHQHGVRAILLRCAGFNNVDLKVAKELGIFVARVPGAPCS
jgi:D-lactate dehydrogenase